MRRLIDITKSLKKTHHRAWLNVQARQDILWWYHGIDIFHGSAKFIQDIPSPDTEYVTDACLTGGGGIYGPYWFYTNFSADFPSYKDEHINTLELLTALVGARKWGHLWAGSHVRIHSDNTATVASVNKGSSRSPKFMACLREIFWLSVKHDFILSAVHVKGDDNFLADTVSRLHAPGQAEAFHKLVRPESGFINCFYNMSYLSFLTLQG